MLNRRFPKNLAHLSENSLFVRFSRLAFFRHGFRHRSVHFIKRGAGQLDATAVPFQDTTTLQVMVLKAPGRPRCQLQAPQQQLQTLQLVHDPLIFAFPIARRRTSCAWRHILPTEAKPN